jgi:hypothetical protein
LAVDAAHLYWYSAGQHAIQRANLDASGGFEPGGFEPSFISGLPPLEGLAVDAAHVYWTNRNPGTIGRANLDGSGVEPSFISGASTGVGGVAVDTAHLYWANGNTIGSANLDGTDIEQSFITDVGSPAGIAVNFSLGNSKKDKKHGTAKLTLEVPAPGGVALAQTKKLKGADVRAEAAGEVQLTITLRGRAKEKLAQKGKAKVTVEIIYTPDGGPPETQTTALKLIKRG